GYEAEPLAANTDHPFSASFISRTRPGIDDMPPLLVLRRYWVGRGMRCDVQVRNDAPELRRVVIEVQLGADMAGLFAVKEGREIGRRNGVGVVSERTSTRFVLGAREKGRQTSIRLMPEAQVTPAGAVYWEADIPARGEWAGCLEFAPILDDQEV